MRGQTLSEPKQTSMSIHELAVPIASHLKSVEKEIEKIIFSEKGFIQDLTQYMISYKGKRIRPALLLLTGHETGGVNEKHIEASAIVELIHTATLVHDDVMDGALTRRHRQSVNTKWTNHTAVMLGDFIYCSAFESLSQWQDTTAYQKLTKITRQMCEGEILQLHNKHYTNLKESDYNQIIKDKTASLFAISSWFGGYVNDLDKIECQKLYQFGESLGMAFQIVDDLIDIIGNEKTHGKSLGTDLKEGKMTLPLIRLLKIVPHHQRGEIIDKIESSSFSVQSKIIREILLDSGATQQTIDSAKDYCSQAIAALDDMSHSMSKLYHIPDIILQEIEPYQF